MIIVGTVEDEPLVTKFHQKYVEMLEGFQWAGSATTLNEGKSLVTNTDMDVLLLDVYLEKENGLELLRYIRNLDLDVDVILVTSANDHETVRIGERLGVVDYLVKPFTFQRFHEAMFRYQRLVSDQPTLYNQHELDRRLHNSDYDLDGDLPKGITKETALRILHAFHHNNEWYTAAELSTMTNISHVSLRKYLRFFVEKKWLEKDLTYQPSGRPVQHYLLSSQGKQLLQT
ncbi:response regulator [Geomicrobium sp. JCM 19039]|uniref:response regulator n=1 Tax=Geomicrobium sp. JCM 19039 TaxID=1460636 RepID=UPI00045F1F3D|nr:response regulator [Geomicrobium sp. JCM 19039]GAK14532.1 two-component response regulator [Geomicrobium sp. JCM 19039]